MILDPTLLEYGTWLYPGWISLTHGGDLSLVTGPTLPALWAVLTGKAIIKGQIISVYRFSFS